jgi:hypothetical protein
VTLVTGNSAGSCTSSVPAVLDVQTPPPPATIGTLSVSGTWPALQITLAGAAGQPSGTYRVLTTTNVTAALSTWLVVTNGTFDANGNFSAAFPSSTTSAQQFYSVVQP